MLILILIAGVGGAYLLSTMGLSALIPASDAVTALDVAAIPPNIMGLPDVAPEDQGGSWSREYDYDFALASEAFGVPFALLKAHAIRESALKSSAFRQEPNGKASYGLMQVLWWKNSNRFNKYGFNDDMIGDGSALYDPRTNISIAAQLIVDNWNWLHDLRDIVNAYNTGVKESTRKAPGNYVNDVLKYYSTLTGKVIQ